MWHSPCSCLPAQAERKAWEIAGQQKRWDLVRAVLGTAREVRPRMPSVMAPLLCC